MSSTQNPLVALQLSGVKAQFIVDLMADETEATEAEAKASSLEAHCKANGLKNGETILESIRSDQKAFADAAKLNTGDIITLRKMLEKVGKPAEEQPKTAPATAPHPIPIIPQQQSAAFSLPDVLGDSGLLEALKTSATLKVDETNIIAVLRAHFANEMGLAMIPEMIADAMERYAESIETPVTNEFLEILEMVNERKYADVNIKGKYVTVARKRQVLDRMRELRPVLANFHSVLTGWNKQLEVKRLSNPLAQLSGTNVYPPHDDVVGAAESVVAFFNRALAGYGPIVARALAYESLKIRDFLERPTLPTMTGHATKELMLKAFKIGLTNADVRLEKNIARYAMFVVTKVATADLQPGQEGAALEALYNLGLQLQGWLSNARTDGRSNPPFPQLNTADQPYGNNPNSWAAGNNNYQPRSPSRSG